MQQRQLYRFKDLAPWGCLSWALPSSVPTPLGLQVTQKTPDGPWKLQCPAEQDSRHPGPPPFLASVWHSRWTKAQGLAVLIRNMS